ncbi:type II secretion system protein [Oxalobacteraceae bacterium R-40]|uniref:Type II secretion system protein n=1 Tax=Keguizhuia sedimenti TaxID=3064264 RepID=A0ABU1BMK8_9BURK|nr:type II secretion system protein [Oxalobacteraceae bacterium R-40]
MLKFLRNLLLMEVLIAVTVVGIFAAVLLNRLSYYQEKAEKANMELTISSIRSALRMRLAGMMIQGATKRYGEVAEDNPMDWLEHKPGNYGGLLTASRNLKEIKGNWFYDPASKSLIYWVKHGDHFRPDSANEKKVRLKIVLIHENGDPASAEANRVAGARIMLAEPYLWFSPS